jgi:hypothetical protein
MPDTMADRDGDIRWMTYGELAIARNISRRSATRLAFKEGWKRIPGNDGHARVAVPMPAIMPRETTSPVQHPGEHDARHDVGRHGAAGFSAALEAVTAAHARETAALEATISAQAQVIATKDSLIAVLRVVADQARAETQEASALQEQLDAAEARATSAEQAAEQARQHVREAEDAIEQLRQTEEARKGRGRWARLRAAWRGE